MFLSQYLNNLDKKGRVSVPSSYRANIGEEDFQGVVIYPSFKNDALEVCTNNKLQEISKIIERLDPYSEERDAFETIIFGAAVKISFDPEGRILIPSHLLDHAQITNAVCFVGKGDVFEIWQPEKFQMHLAAAKLLAHKNRAMLRINKINY